MVSVIYFLSSLLASVSAMYSSKALEGYPAGYLPDCPGSTNEAIIMPKTLKHLTFTIQGPGGAIAARRIRYTYFQMKALAKDPDMDFKKKTLLYVGGFLDSPGYPMAWIMAKHYKDLGYNVLLLDTNYFTTTDYPIAVRYMRPVGKHTAEMLANLTKLGLDPKKLEVVGLSLGGHTISYIAKNYRLITGRNISRLTALDPAGPCFRNLGPEDRLDQTDADFVDVIDTNIDGFGMAAPVGHVNFYVNGGEFQPGDFLWMPCNVLCSHARAFTIWLAALENPNSFIALQCDSVQQARERNCYERKPQVTNLLGPKTDRTKQGLFYLATYNNFPYFMGEKGLKRENEFFETNLKAFNPTRVIQM
ncbi:lipase member H-A-like [Pectinophora gossypiella]|uniref:lipase member H-A-like n=1 Tax=Pectinophora gossypiella TaxID=13191 RepID=UPI00214E21B7|nr:lipase member H-A-like [Pectinophora gossypiella]